MRRERTAVQYAEQMRRRFGLWPAWLPDTPMAVGDYGRVRRGVFIRDGHLSSLTASVSVTRSNSAVDHMFTSRDVRHVVLNGGGKESSLGLTARLQIDFGKSFGVFVALRNCRETRLADSVATASHLANKTETGDWQGSYCLVTSVIEAQAALIAVGSSRGGQIEIAGSAPVPNLLSWITGELQVLSESSVSYRTITNTGCTPLFRLSKLVHSGELLPRGATLNAPRLREIETSALSRARQPSAQAQAT